MKDLESSEADGPILYVLVVGFHHKKGCLIEYCFPEMKNYDDDDGDDKSGSGSGNIDDKAASEVENKGSFKLPKVWKTLPSVALPDGAHNYDRDTIYFHLPNPEKPLSTVYGISCYRQIASEKLHRKTDDVTRGTVQKSVVLLSQLPLYGLIAAKCEMITYAYFNEFDFSKVDCLKELYFNLNGMLTKDYLNSSEVFLGLSPRELVSIFQHKVLILFKLILLEKKVLFYKSPVKDLCTIILTLLSLFPGMIEEGGLDYSSASVVPKSGLGRKFSGDIELVEPLMQEIINQKESQQTDSSPNHEISSNQNEVFTEHRKDEPSELEAEQKTEDVDRKESQLDLAEEALGNEDSVEKAAIDDQENFDETILKDDEKIFEEILRDEVGIDDSKPADTDELPELRSATPPLLKLSHTECGLPLRIFVNGAFCHPYLSITYLDILSDPRVRSCVVGATNFLFKQKRNLFDVIIEVDSLKIEINDPELKRRLNLSTEDLRFADYLVKATLDGQVINKNSNITQCIPNDGSSWEGCDDWLRYQFKIYLLHLLRTSECEGTSKEYSSFNPLFLNTWKETYNYRLWSSTTRPGIFEVNPGHPFHGQLSISDMRLKLSQAVLSSERGKKLNQTLGQTSKAVGGALSSAKTAVSSWWSSQWTSSSSSTTNRSRDSSPSPLISSYSLSGLLKSMEKNPQEGEKPKDEVEDI